MSYRHHVNYQRTDPGANRPARIIPVSLLWLLAVALSQTLSLTVGCAAPSAASREDASASVSTTTVTFGDQAAGTKSAAKTVTLTNTGKGSLNISGITLAGSNPSDFAQTNGCGASLAGGASCSISVFFEPSASGTFTASLGFTDSGHNGTPPVSLSGTGTGTASTATATISPSSLTFATETVGVTSAAQTVTLTNSGGAALTLSVALTGAYPNNFTQTNTCGSSVAAGASCTVSVAFKPVSSGTQTAALTFTDNATSSPQNVSLSGTGTSASATASVSPSSLTFASETVGVASAAQTVTLTNSGTAALTLSVALSGADPSDFTQTNTCGSSVAAGSSCTLSVTFKPAASGTLTAALTLTDNATGSPQSVSLSGTGASASPTASVSPSSVSFGDEPVDVVSGSQVVTLSNTGGAALSISGITVTGADPTDFTENNTCGSSLAAGGNCAITLSFTPGAAGSRTAALSVADNATGSPQTSSLSGTGTHDVVLTWTASPSSGIAGYNVYRGTTSGAESATPLNSSLVTGTTFTDENVTAGQTYYYTVTAVVSNSGGTVQSADSNQASVTVP